MTSPAVETAQWLEVQNSGGVGTIAATTGWAIAVGMEPTVPDDTITIYDTGGSSPDNDDYSILSHTLQVRVRSASYVNGYAKHEEIRDLLLAFGAFGSFFLVVMESEPGVIGRDDNDRFLFTANYRLMREV